MKRSGISRATLMLMLCLLPLIVFFALALAGVRISPLLVPLVVILCCLAMSYLLAGSCEHGRSHATGCGRGHTEPAAQPAPEKPAAPIPCEVKTDDIFWEQSSRRVGEALVVEGELLRDPDEAYDLLAQRFARSGVTPLLQEDKDGRPFLALLPGEAEQREAAARLPWINLGLFLATIVTTTWAGALHAGVNLWQESQRFTVGLPYALTLVLILGTHELGHYFTARVHHMRVTLPYFIPIPFGLGTFGAFIQLKSTPPNRRALFDVGVAGPLAGLVIAVPALWIGLQHSSIIVPGGASVGMHGGMGVGSSLLMALVAKLALGEGLSEGHELLLHPLAFAGWLGLLVTALNLLPIGQLDGGHMADAMLGRARSAALGTAALLGLLFLGLFVWSGLLTWAFIVYFVAGCKGMPPLNDVTPLSLRRQAVGIFAFVLLVLILMPVPHRLYDALAIHCPYL